MTSKRNATSFIITKIEGRGAPGAIQFVTHPDDSSVVGFNHACPCGCGKWSFVRLNPAKWAPGEAPMWTREGDDLHMTLVPSIGIHPIMNGAYHWHGFLRNGIFEEC